MNLSFEEANGRRLPQVCRQGSAVVVSALVFADGTQGMVRRHFLFASHWLAHLDRADLERFAHSRLPGEAQRVRDKVLEGFVKATRTIEEYAREARLVLLSDTSVAVSDVPCLKPAEVTVQLRTRFDNAMWDLIIKSDQTRTDIARYCELQKVDKRYRFGLMFPPKQAALDAIATAVDDTKALLSAISWDDRPRTATRQIDLGKLQYAR